MIIPQGQKVPVFYHVPKCAGTWFWAACIRASLEHSAPDKIRQIDVNLKSDGIRKLRLLASGEGEFFTQKKNIALDQAELDDFLLEQKTTSILAANIEPTADFHPTLHHVIRLLTRFGGGLPATMLLMRHPLARVQSLFYYLRDVGNWEPTAGLIRAKTFDSYIHSGQCESNWLVRRLSSLTDQDEVSDEAFEKAKSRLGEFDLVGTTEQISEFLEEAQARFNIQVNPGQVEYFGSKEVENRNLVSKKEPLSPEALERFNEINKYDIALYDFFSKESKQNV